MPSRQKDLRDSTSYAQRKSSDAACQSSGYSTSVINHDSDFQRLRKDWNILVRRVRPESVFLRHEWFDAAWQWRKADCSLSIVLVYRDRRLTGICPLILCKHKRRLGTVRTLEFLTVPDTQLCDIIAHRETHASVVEELVFWLMTTSVRWDVIDLRHISAHSPTCTALPKFFAKQGIKSFNHAQERNHFVTLTANWEEFYKNRSRRLKKSNNLAANHLKRAGEISVAWVRDSKSCCRILEKVINISANSWKEITGLTLNNPAPNAFIETLTAHAAAHGWLSIWILYLRGEPIAAEYQLIYGDSVHALRADFDESYGTLSPGTYLNWKLLKQLFTSGYSRYYLGRGDNPYKLRWSNTAEEMTGVIGYNSTISARILYVVERCLRPALREVARLLQRIITARDKRGAER